MFADEDDDVITGKPKRWRRFAKHFPFLAYSLCGLTFALLIGAVYVVAYYISYWLLWRGREVAAFIVGFSCAGLSFLWGSYILYRRNGGRNDVDFRETFPVAYPKKHSATRPAEDDSVTDKDCLRAIARIRKRRRGRG